MTQQSNQPTALAGSNGMRTASLTADDYRNVLDGVPFAVLVRKPGEFLYANRTALEIFGASSLDDFSNRGLELIHPDDREGLRSFVKMAGDGNGTTTTFEFRCMRIDGTDLHMEAACSKIMFGSEPAKQIVMRDVTNRKRGHDLIRRQAEVMEGINRILRAALKYETEEELGSACLSVAEEITQSPLGFIGDVKEAGLEKITLHAQKGQPPMFGNAAIPMMPHGGFNMHSLYGSVLSEGLSFFTNDTRHFANWNGVPDGHPMLDAFMGVPLKHEGKTIGMIGLANRPGGYTALEQDCIEALAPAIVEAFMRKRMEVRMQQLFDQTRRDAITKSDLLNEVNHRVKNNLMTILGLILAEKRHMPQEQLVFTEHIWEKFELRISGLLKVHQMLSDVQWTPMNVSELAVQICSGILNSFDMADTVALSVAAASVEISPRQSNNIALIFNELMTNSLKYAFQDTPAPAVTIDVYSKDATVCITFSDNGNGFPEDVLAHGRQNVGLRLVRQLVTDSLGGTVDLRNSGGAVAEIRFQMEKVPTTSQ